VTATVVKIGLMTYWLRLNRNLLYLLFVKCFQKIKTSRFIALTFFLLIKAVAMVKKTSAYKNKLRALELERNGGITNTKKGQKNKDRYGIILILYSPCV
jgi:hypothetical protein